MLFIGFNMLTMTLDHYKQSDTFSNVLDCLNMIFIVIFSSECLMKIFALRYHYFVEPWNLFDFVVVILSILGKLPSIPWMCCVFSMCMCCAGLIKNYVYKKKSKKTKLKQMKLPNSKRNKKKVQNENLMVFALGLIGLNIR